MRSVVIQAGGQSRRMGQNKALLPFLGRPLIERVIERVRPAGDELLLTANETEAFNRLGFPVYPDILPDIGALGGLLTALTYAAGECAAVVACDMPFASLPLLQLAFKRLEETSADVVIPRLPPPGGYEPFHAVYRREVCRSAVDAALQAGERRMISWFDRVRVVVLDPVDIQAADPSGLAFLNVNTPEEFRQAEELARELDAGFHRSG